MKKHYWFGEIANGRNMELYTSHIASFRMIIESVDLTDKRSMNLLAFAATALCIFIELIKR